MPESLTLVEAKARAVRARQTWDTLQPICTRRRPRRRAIRELACARRAVQRMEIRRGIGIKCEAGY